MTPNQLRRGLALVALAAALALLASCRSGSKAATSTPQAAGGTQAAGTATQAALTASDVGVTPAEIKLGATTPLSGAYSAYYADTLGMKVYFDYVNDHGGVNGRKIVFITKDDQTNPSVALAGIKTLATDDKVFAFAGVLGTMQNAATVGYINDEHIPNLFTLAATSFLNDPQKYPWTFPGIFPYTAEGRVLAAYVKQNLTGHKVGILYQNDDFGKDELKNFVPALGTGLKVVGQQSYEVSSTDVSTQMTALKNAGADVVVLFAIPKFATLALKFIHDSGWKPTILMSYVSATTSVIKDAGAAAVEGVITDAYLPSATDLSNAQVAFAKEIMTKYAPGQQFQDLNLFGIAAAQLTVRALELGGPNLTRAGVVKAAESIRNYQTVALAPASVGATDHNPFHCAQLMKVQQGQFAKFGSLTCEAGYSTG